MRSTSTSVNYGIDVVGNQTTDGRKTYGIDASGRFDTLSQGTGRDRQSMLYLHNALGQRVFKSEFTSEDYEPSEEDLGKDYVTWLRSRFGWMFAAKKDERMKLGTAYVYDEDGNIMGETGNGGASSNGTTDYIWLPTPAGTSVLVGAVVNGNPYAVHTDHLGTPRRLTDAQNKPAWQLAYSAFGDNAPTTAQNHFKPTATMSEGDDKKAALTFNLRFPGQYFDAESGLSYNYLRTYDARTGRYTQSDPIGLNGGWNRFTYVGGNPLSRVDPLGLWALNIGISLSVTVPGTPIAFNGGFGIVADGNGNIGGYSSLGAGVGVGAAGSLGVNAGVYPGAKTINDFGGPFNNANFGAGAGPYGSIDIFQDPSKSATSPSSYGGGFTVGIGIGGSGSVTRTDTSIYPLGNTRPMACGRN